MNEYRISTDSGIDIIKADFLELDNGAVKFINNISKEEVSRFEIIFIVPVDKINYITLFKHDV